MKDYDAIMKRCAKADCESPVNGCKDCPSREQCNIIMNAYESGLNIAKLLSALDKWGEDHHE